MPLRPLPYREIKRRLEAVGFAEVSRRGSHVKFAKSISGGIVTVIVPDHREVPIGTLRSILRQAGLTPEEFDSL
jgi:predicted RNA binding protein YcfA (HicA-like mRNA interferase family)